MAIRNSYFFRVSACLATVLALAAKPAGAETRAPDFQDEAAILKALGGDPDGRPIVTMGPTGGMREGRRLPLRVEFDTDRDTIRPEAEAQVEALGKALATLVAGDSEAAFVIEGHTDERGSDAHNDELSLRRARSVARVLTERYGVPPGHLAVRGYGKRRPVAGGSGEAAWQVDRRVEVVRQTVGELAKLVDAQVFTPSSTPEPTAVFSAPAAADGVRLEAAVFYEDVVESRPRKLHENATLRSGEGYRVYFRPSRRQHLYVVQQDASKKLFQLFPNAEYGYESSAVEAGREYWVPGVDDKWLELDDTRGTETIYFIASDQPRSDLEEIIRRGAAPAAGATVDAGIESEYVIKTMGPARVREGRGVMVAASAGPSVQLSVDALVGDGADLLHKVSFRHE